MSFNDLDKNSILDKITPCCALPFSVMYWFLENVTLLDNTDLNLRNYLVNSIQQNGVLKAEAWKVFAENVVLEPNSVITRSDLLIWLDGQKKPTCDQLRLIITESDFGNWTPPFNIPENIATVDMGVLIGNAYTKTQTDNIISSAVQTLLGGVDPDTDTFKEVRDKLLELMQADAGLTPLSMFNDLVNNILPTYARKYPINFTNEERDAWYAFFNISTTMAQPHINGLIDGTFVNGENIYVLTFSGLNLTGLNLGLTAWKIYDKNGAEIPASNYTIGTFEVVSNSMVKLSVTFNNYTFEKGVYSVKLFREMTYLGVVYVNSYNSFSENLITSSSFETIYGATPPAGFSAGITTGNLKLWAKSNNATGVYRSCVRLNYSLPITQDYEITFYTQTVTPVGYSSLMRAVAGMEYEGILDYLPTKMCLGSQRERYYADSASSNKIFVYDGGASLQVFNDSPNTGAGSTSSHKTVFKKFGTKLKMIVYKPDGTIGAEISKDLLQNSGDLRFAFYSLTNNTGTNDAWAEITGLTLKTYN